MDNFLKDFNTKPLIGFLALIVVIFFSYIYFDGQKKSNMSLIIEKRPTQVRLLDFKIEKNGFFVNIQDIKTNEKFEDIFLSKICPMSDQNNLGKVMEINKLVLYKVQEDLKTTSFDGLYDYLCTDKKNTVEKPENVKK